MGTDIDTDIDLSEDSEVEAKIEENESADKKELKSTGEKFLQNMKELFTSDEDLAKDPDTPAETLMRLAKEGDSQVIGKMISRENIPAEIIMTILESGAGNSVDRYMLWEHKDTPAEGIQWLYNNTDRSSWTIDGQWYHLAKHPNTPKKLLQAAITYAMVLEDKIPGRQTSNRTY